MPAGQAPESQAPSGPQAPRPAHDLLPLVYDQLRNLARQRMAQERTGHTLQATALVHEAFARLVGPGGGADARFANVAHFYHAAAEAMRRILIEHARRHGRVKRGGGRQRVPLDVLDLATYDPEHVIAVDEALQRLAQEDPRAADVVRLRFYAGLSVEETAQALELSERTVRREWEYARACLYRSMQ